ncbi:MAG TPA: CHAD domain-containing protein [Nitrososphaeraceae archaeon]
MNNKLDDYLKDPNEEQIHDIRTAVRRLRASNQALPKAIRNKKELREFVAKSKALFTLNSKIRDYDIILELLSKYTEDVSSPKREQQQVSPSSQVIVNISKSLEILRNRKLTASKTLAVELRKLAVPKLNNDKINKSEKKLKKRFNKVVGKFANIIEKNYPVVLSSPKRLAELHEMRKDCKKLRYLLELLPGSTNGKDEGKDKSSQLIEELEKVQDMLGTIHDYDTTIAYIQKYLENHPKDRSSLHNIVKYLYEDRQKKFEQFADFCKADLSNSKNNLFLNIMNIT